MESGSQNFLNSLRHAASAVVRLLRASPGDPAAPWDDDHPLSICQRGVQHVLDTLQNVFACSDDHSCEEYCRLIVETKLGEGACHKSSEGTEDTLAESSGWQVEPFIDGAISLLHLLLRKRSDDMSVSRNILEMALEISQIVALLSSTQCGHKCLCDLSAGTRLNAEVRWLLRHGTDVASSDDILEAKVEELTTSLTAAVSNVLSALPPEIERTVSVVTLKYEPEDSDEIRDECFPVCICDQLRGRLYVNIAKDAESATAGNLQASVISVRARQLRDTDAGVGALIWPSSLIAARSLACSSEEARSSFSWVLELGAGIGLAGLACAMQGHAQWVVLTDYHETLLANLRHSVKISGLQCRGVGGHHAHVAVTSLDWSISASDLVDAAAPENQTCLVCGDKGSTSPRNTRHGYDLIIGADVIYDEVLGPMVASALEALLTSNTLGIVFTPSSRQGVSSFRRKISTLQSLELTEKDVHDCLHMDTSVAAQTSFRHTYKRFLVKVKDGQ